MKLTEKQIERWENPPRKHSRRKKNVVVQYRAGSGHEYSSLFRQYLSYFYREWSTFGKYSSLEDAGKAMKLVARKDHIFHNYDFRVLIKGEHILKQYVTPENLATMLIHGKEEDPDDTQHK